MKLGIKSIGAYLPYYYIQRDKIGAAWGGRGQRGEKSIINVDEDSLTMAVESAMDCFRYISRDEITALYFASTTAPYLEKSNSALVAVACDLDNEKVFSSDFAHSTKAGTNAIKAAFDAAMANSSQNVLVTATDVRNAYPKSSQEQTFGDGAAALVIGSGEVFAVIDKFVSINHEIVDVWRNEGDKYVHVGEDRFISEEGYMAVMKKVILKLLNDCNLKSDDISKVVFSAPTAKDIVKIAKKTGFKEEQIQDTLLFNVGDTGTAQSLFGIIGALESAQPGDKILVADYGSGANAMLLTVTEEVINLKDANTIKRFLDTRFSFDSYARFLSFREIAPAQPGSPFKLPASASMTWREQNMNIRLHASHCKKCGAGLFPVNRICHKCGSKDEYEEVRASDKITKVFTYSIDNYAGRSDDPVLVQTVTEDSDGIRYYTIMTDFQQRDVHIGMELEFTFRKMHTLGNFNNYYWKLRPVRREIK